MAEFITAQRAELDIPTTTTCRALGVSQAWYYKWRDGDPSASRVRRVALDAAVAAIFARHHGTYGSPRITTDLREDDGWRVSENTVADSMRRQGLVARGKRRRRSTTRPGRGYWKAPDRIGRDFAAERLNQKWYGDGTEIDTDEGKLILDSVLDMGSRRIIGFALSEHPDAALAYAALSTAVATRGGKEQVAGVVFHTDQGSEYTARDYRAACERMDIDQSMGRPGSGLDNAVIESWHSTLEFELRKLSHFHTKAEARAAVAAWIEDYNHDRRHSALGMRSPMAYEQTLTDGGTEAA